jgi:hypothetical protein
MSPAARSIQVFGIYLMLLALALLLRPSTLLGLFGVAPTDEVWIRVVGMLVGFLGYYYWQAARAGLAAFFAWTVPARLSVPVFFGAFVLLGMAPPALLLFGAVDAAAALWTWSALRKS